MRITISVLTRRINQLSQFIQDNELEVPPMPDSDYSTIKDIFEASDLLELEALSGRKKVGGLGISTAQVRLKGGLEAEGCRPGATPDDNIVTGLQNHLPGPAEEKTAISEGLLPPITSVYSFDTVNRTSSAPVADESQNVASPLIELADSNLFQIAPRAPVTETDPPDSNEEEEEDEVTNQLSCRLGKLQVTHGGQLRYFGPTSNFTLLDILVDIAPSTPVSIQKGTQEILDSADLGLTVDEAFEKHLLQLYFAWNDPCLHVVSEEIFWRSRRRKIHDGVDTPYYSRSLVDAM